MSTECLEMVLPKDMKGLETYEHGMKLQTTGEGIVIVRFLVSREIRLIFNDSTQESRTSKKNVVNVVFRDSGSKYGTEIATQQRGGAIARHFGRDCSRDESVFWVLLSREQGGTVQLGTGEDPGLNMKISCTQVSEVLKSKYIGIAFWKGSPRVQITVKDLGPPEYLDLPDDEKMEEKFDNEEYLPFDYFIPTKKYINFLGSTGSAASVIDRRAGTINMFCFEAWLKVDEECADPQTIVAARSNDGTIVFLLQVEGGDIWTYTGYVRLGDRQVPLHAMGEPGKWNHILVSFNPSTFRVQTWMNGNLMHDRGVEGEFAGISRIMFGASAPDQQPLHGGLGLIRLWSEFFTRDQIKRLSSPQYLSGEQFGEADEFLELCLLMDEVVDDMVLDMSGNERHATLSPTGWQEAIDESLKFV